MSNLPANPNPVGTFIGWWVGLFVCSAIYIPLGVAYIVITMLLVIGGGRK